MSKKENGRVKHLRTMIKHQEAKRDKITQAILALEIELALALEEASKPPPKPLPPVIDEHKYCGKIPYVSQDQARSAMRLINRDLKQKGTDLLRRAYFCQQCEAWHLTTIWTYHGTNA